MSGVTWHPFALGIGSNLGRRSSLMSMGLSMLAATERIRGLRRSDFERTDPVLPPGESSTHPSYLNAVAIGETRLEAGALMARLLAIETALGRRRGEGCRPRTLDLDLLLFGDQRIDEPGLRVPHPRFPERSFVTRPLRKLLEEVSTEPVWRPFRPYVEDVD